MAHVRVCVVTVVLILSLIELCLLDRKPAWIDWNLISH